jgi:hypothetical protein
MGKPAAAAAVAVPQPANDADDELIVAVNSLVIIVPNAPGEPKQGAKRRKFYT